MSDPKIEKLNKLLELLQNETVTPKKIEEFLTLVLGVIKQSKDAFEQISKDNLNKVDSAVGSISKKCSEAISILEQKSKDISKELSNEFSKEFQPKIDEAMALLKEIKALDLQPGTPGEPGKPGKDADEERIIEKVLDRIKNQIKIPKDNEMTLDEGEQLVAKINSLSVNPENQIDASHIKNLPVPEPGGRNGRGISNLMQLLSPGTNITFTGNGIIGDPYVINASGGGSSPLTTKGDLYTYSTTSARLPVGTDGYILSADSSQATGLKWIANSGGGGTWGSITGTLSSQTDLQTALDAKVNLSQTSAQTIGATGARLLKLWATDITVTNAITGSVTGNAGTATTLQNARTIAGVSFDGTANIAIPASGLSNGVTGSGSVVLATSPTLSGASLGSSTATTQAPSDNSTKLATTAYVDAAVLGQNFKEAVGAATTANLVGIYLNGSSGVGATFTYTATGVDTIDGVTLTLGMRVLLKNQTSTFQNGIYTVTTAGALGIAGILTRATDANQSSEWKTGDSVFVTAGTTLATTTWAYTGNDSPVMGTDAITFAQTAGQGSFTAGNGIGITGVSIAIDTSVTVDKTTAQVLFNKDLSASSNTFPTNLKIESVGITIDGAGQVISTGSKGYITIPYAGTISANTLLADQSGSIVIDVKKSTFSGFPTTSSIAASALPTLSSAQKSTDSTLTGWTTSVAAGDVLEFVVNSATTITRVNLVLKIIKT